jgi:hypothetical protein
VLAAFAGGRDEQLRLCELLARSRWTRWTVEVEQRLYQLANDPDVGLRNAARRLIANSLLDRLSRPPLRKPWPEPASPVSPDGWIPGIGASKALVLLGFLGAGYDHRMPSKYKRNVGALVDDLVGMQDLAGVFTADPRDHALITETLAEAFAMSNDPALREPLIRAMDILRLAHPDGDAARLWAWDTTLAMIQVSAWNVLKLGGLAGSDELQRLAVGLDAAWAKTMPDHARFPWYTAGREVAMRPWQ